MKAKTRKSLAKRVHTSKTGKVLRLAMSSQHLARRKSPRARTSARKARVVPLSNIKIIKHFLPYL
ncbi:50S ribosomal protein L35 [Candidatus Berkelbacteria bacterium]|nr:50S ribosomal protein L35 [Candidatus Berkelbacteria bacterium]